MENRLFKKLVSARAVVLSTICVFSFSSAPSALVITSNEDARQLCITEMATVQAATDTQALHVRRHDNVPYVYGVADFADIDGIKFRCKVFEEKVREVMYLVKDPEYVNGRAWSKTRPRGAEHSALQLDEPAMSAPPLDHPSPHFVRVPD